MSSYLIQNNLSQDRVLEVIRSFKEFGVERSCRIEIRQDRSEGGYYPALISSFSFLDRVLRFFGWKPWNRRLEVVSSFLIEWLQSNMNRYREAFVQEQDSLLVLRPLFNKSGNGGRFNHLIQDGLRENENALQVAIEEVRRNLAHVPLIATQSMQKEVTTIVECAKTDIQRAIEEKQKIKEELERELMTMTSQQGEVSVFTPVTTWPRNRISEISAVERTVIDSIVSKVVALLRRGDVSIEYLAKDTVIINRTAFSFPYPIKFIKNPSSRDIEIILFVKTLIGEGGQRKVRSCIGLRKGQVLVRKKSEGVEVIIAKYFHAHPARGIVPVQAVIEASNKTTLIEERFDSDLLKIFKEGTYLSTSDISSVMVDLLSGLNSLHALFLQEASITICGVRKVKSNFCFFHKDIKPANILVRHPFPHYKLEAALCDYGIAANVSLAIGTMYFRSPEIVREYLRVIASSAEPLETLDFYHEYGQISDVWSLGLIFVSLALGGRVSQVGGLKEGGFPPISSIERLFLCGPKSNISDGHLEDLQQGDLDYDLETLQRSVCGDNKVWDVIKRMLRVNPRERITAKAAIEFLSSR